jgi:hypothetical protein
MTFNKLSCKFEIFWPSGSWIDYLPFYVPLKNFSLIWRHHHCRWGAAKFRPMLSAQGLWAGSRDFYCATPAVTRDLCFFGFIGRTAPFSCLLLHTREYGGSILTRILTGAVILGKKIYDTCIISLYYSKHMEKWSPPPRLCQDRSFHVNLSFSGHLVLDKISKWPHPIFAFMLLSPLYEGLGPLFENFKVSNT